MSIPTHMIVIDGDSRSEYYYHYCSPSWQKLGLTVNKFKAVTPKTLKREYELNFSKYSMSGKYTNQGIKADITDTEKACFYSHYKLWQEAVYLNQPIFILEHDCLLLEPDKFWVDDSHGIIFYDKAAMGSYVIYPSFARELVQYCMANTIGTGPYAIIEQMCREYNIMDQLVNVTHKKFNPISDQVMSRKYGNTVTHYSDIDTTRTYKQHNFIMID